MYARIDELRREVSGLYQALGTRAIEPFIGDEWLRPDRLRLLGVGINSYVTDAHTEPAWFRSWFAEGKHRFYPAARRELNAIGAALSQSALFRGLNYRDSHSSAYVTNAIKTYLTVAEGRHAADVPAEQFEEHNVVWLKELDLLARYDALPHAVVVFGSAWWSWAWKSFAHSAKPWIRAYECTPGPLLHRLHRVKTLTQAGSSTLLLIRLTHPAARTRRWRAAELISHADFMRVAKLENGGI